jgi:hypothetical protein
MKKFVGLLLVSLIGLACYSQDSIKLKDAKMQDTSMMSGGKMKGCLLMKNGQVMLVRSGQKNVLNRPMTLDNGTSVAPDGTVTMTNGKTKKLMEGQWIGMNGKMGKTKWDKKDGTNSDSTSMQ